MPSILALLRPVALVTLAHASLQRAATGAKCDAGQLAALTSREPTDKELLRLCNSRYSESTCLAAGRSLSAEFGHEHQSGVSLQQWASAACDAVEAAELQQRALLLRQHRVSRGHSDVAPAVETRDLADIRSSASVHRLSLDVARRYRGQVAEADMTMSSAAKTDNVLHHKSIGLPHQRFEWETNHSENSSALLDKAVEDWKKEQRAKLNAKSPEVANRANAFKGFVTNSTKTSGNTGKAALQQLSKTPATSKLLGQAPAPRVAQPRRGTPARELDEVVDDVMLSSRKLSYAQGTVSNLLERAPAPRVLQPLAATTVNEVEDVVNDVMLSGASTSASVTALGRVAH